MINWTSKILHGTSVLWDMNPQSISHQKSTEVRCPIQQLIWAFDIPSNFSPKNRAKLFGSMAYLHISKVFDDADRCPRWWINEAQQQQLTSHSGAREHIPSPAQPHDAWQSVLGTYPVSFARWPTVEVWQLSICWGVYLSIYLLQQIHVTYFQFLSSYTHLLS